jgi:two-component system LytT family sensor kinase
MDPARATEVLSGRGGGVGIANVQARLQNTFGPAYGLEIESAAGDGTTVTMTLPKFRAGVRAA